MHNFKQLNIIGYPINSVWIEMHKNDIEKLNDIIDDKYLKEIEIGRKLGLMKDIEEAFEDEVQC